MHQIDTLPHPTARSTMPTKYQSRYRTLLLLLVAYGLATWLPTPGIWLRSLRLSPLDPPAGIQVQHVMLALMLFCASLGSSTAGLRQTCRSGDKVLAVTFLSWLIPASAGILVVAVLAWLPTIALEVRLAILIVSAMPVANSTAGWANQLGANIPLSLAVLIAATLLSPLITAPLINLGIYVTGLQRDGANVLPAWGNDMSTFFAMWVLVPVAAGVVLSQTLPKASLVKLRPWAARTSLAMLLSLNYINATVCLPGLVSKPGQFFEPLLSSGLLIGCIVSLFACYKNLHLNVRKNSAAAHSGGASAVDRDVTRRPADELSLLLAVVMRNTGAAIVYTSTALASVPLVSLVVLFYTVLQHLVIAAVAGLTQPTQSADNDSAL